MNKIIRGGWLVVYYLIARHLDSTICPFMNPFFKRIRYNLCKRLFKHIGSNINICSNVYFGKAENV